jgi:hypothetical protein
MFQDMTQMPFARFLPFSGMTKTQFIIDPLILASCYRLPGTSGFRIPL